MTATRDLDGKLRAWLDLMPDEAPDRAIASVIDAIDATPQSRRSRWWSSWRLIPMNRSLAALGAAAVIVVAATFLMLRPGTSSSVGTIGSPSPSAPSGPSASASPASPSAVPSAAAAGGPVPAELLGRWMGGHNSFVSSGAGSSIVFGQDTFAIEAANENGRPLMAASASSTGPGQLRLATADRPGCQVGDVGAYTWTRSPSGRVLTIRAVSDDCAARGEALAGTWWQMHCRNTRTDCLGDLDAGTYASQYITPRLNAGAVWNPQFGGITYTVPDGWANSQDWPNTFTLTPSASYAHETPDGPPDHVRHEIFVFKDPAAIAQNGSCQRLDASVGRTADALASWLAGQPFLATSTPAPITIGGVPGQVIDLSLRSSYTNACPGDTSPSAGLFAPAQPSDNGWGFGISKGERLRLILLDLGGGHVTGVAIDDWPAAGAASGFEALVQAATPVVQSFQFGAAP